MFEFDEKAAISRIIELRKKFGGTRGKSKFAKTLGISPSTYNYYEDDRLPPISVLLRICEVTGTDLHWLATGCRQSSPDSQSELTKKLNALLETSPQSEAALIAFIELLSEKKTVEKRLISKIPQSSSQRPDWIPILGRTAAGMVHFWHQSTLPEPKDAIVELDELVEKYIGRAILSSSGADISVDFQIGPLVRELKTHRANLIQVTSHGDDYAPDQVVEFVESDQIHQLFPDAFALQIDGDSMAPRINDGDIVILSPSVPAAQGHVAVVKLDDQIGVTCKLVRTTQEHVHLIPINERYETKIVSKKNLLWALAVLCHLSI